MLIAVHSLIAHHSKWPCTLLLMPLARFMPLAPVLQTQFGSDKAVGMRLLQRAQLLMLL